MYANKYIIHAEELGMYNIVLGHIDKKSMFSWLGRLKHMMFSNE